LALNKTKVFPARIKFVFNKKLLELFILERKGDLFNVLVKPGKLFKIGAKYNITNVLSFEIISILDDGSRNVKFSLSEKHNLYDYLNKIGEIPLPPYIKDAEEYFDNYQTVYSDDNFKNSVAAPTAGLHFTEDLLIKLKEKGVSFIDLVLSVGRGTFLPVKTEKLEDHKMHFEEFLLPLESAKFLNNNINKKRLIAVGTTSVRVLESSFLDNRFSAASSKTNLFIYPNKYKWKCVDALITNFHLPKSTLVMLVASFLENKGVDNPIEKLLSIYEEAKIQNYRFYSFGDSMFIF
jgi:S-adenosylmethionine:tRNA ribosyltransferase-isomerase